MSKEKNTETAIITSTKSVALDKAFIKLENEIRTANKSFLIIGRNLSIISEAQLYKARGFVKFETYVQTMFAFTRDYAYKLMNANRVYGVIFDAFKANELPVNETQCRPLTKLEADKDIIKVWRKVLKSGSVMGKTVQEQVNIHLGKGTAPAPEPETTTDGGTGGGDVGDLNASDEISALDKLRIAQARITELENELEKARSQVGGIAKTKMAREIIQAGYAHMVTSATAAQKKELTACKRALLG